MTDLQVRARARLNLIAAAAVVITTVATGAGASAAPNNTTTGSAAGCPAVVGEFLPGTWETNQGADPTQPVGILAPVATELKKRFGEKFEFEFANYAARAFDGMAYGDSKATAVSSASAKITSWAQRCPATKFLLAGFSQGADGMGDIATDIGCKQQPIPSQRILGVGLVADPKQGTSGGKLVGPEVTGSGIAGTRPSGFCSLSAVTAQMCAPDDKYCSTNASQNPVLAALGRTLEQSTSGDPATAGGAAGQAPTLTSSAAAATGAPVEDQSKALTSSLVSGVSRPDLEALPGNLKSLADQAKSGQPDAAAIGPAATSATNTLASLGDLVSWAARNPSVSQGLAGAPAGSAENVTSQFLSAATKMDIPGALGSIATIAQNLTPPPGPPAAAAAGSPSLAGAGEQLSAQTAPVGITPAQTWSMVSGALSILKPSVMVNQVVNVASNTVSFAVNLPKVLDTLRQLGVIVMDAGKDINAKIKAVHDVFRQLNTLFEPLVKMAAGVDMHMVSSILAMFAGFDPSGTTAIVALVVGLLGNVDVIRAANRVGELQEALWHIIETGDFIGGGMAMIAPVLDFATIGLNALTGSAAKTSPDMLGQSSTGPSAMGVSSIAGAAGLLTNAAGSQGADSLATLVSDGISAASFFASGAHQSYDKFLVDGQRTAVQWLTDWFANRIRQVVV